jgi:hypothetical protein
MTDRELLQQSLNELEHYETIFEERNINKIIIAIKARLAQPESVPLLQREPTKIFGPNLEGILNKAGFYKNKEWVGLTDEERNACLVEADPCEALLEHEAWQLMVDIEAKLKEKNT